MRRDLFRRLETLADDYALDIALLYVSGELGRFEDRYEVLSRTGGRNDVRYWRIAEADTMAEAIAEAEQRLRADVALDLARAETEVARLRERETELVEKLKTERERPR